MNGISVTNGIYAANGINLASGTAGTRSATGTNGTTGKKGTLYFFTGLSGAGKTTIGGAFHRRRKAENNATVLLDGDSIRPVYLDSIGYSDADRLLGAKRTFRVGKMLTDQNIDVVVCSICMYTEVRDWNREHIENYREIYIKVSKETLYRRDQKGLYSSGTQVVGIDLPFDEPKTPDIIIENDGDENPAAIVDRLEEALGLR